MADDAAYDIEFFWDPICPFAWITSRWIDKVVHQTGYSVDWQFFSLRLINRDKDYATHFPPEYPRLHGAGLRMLRVAASVRAEVGRDPMGPLYSAFGASIWDQPPGGPGGLRADVGEAAHIEGVLASVDLAATFAAAADDESWDDEILEESERALSRTGHDVGTPIISFHPPDGPSFFGPVISRIPSDEDAVRLWDAVIELATFPGFAEMKRSLRELPGLKVLGHVEDAPELEDWEAGRRRG
ncbi:MAG TPA: hypothetical protein VMX12_02345 [Acidimicrobiia bacterium]|nr:hypothetical protein [Acidimicrobiia bacterium]